MQVTRKYVAVARIMKAYEEQKYVLWKEQVNASLMSYLKKNLLIRPSLTSSTGNRLDPNSNIASGNDNNTNNNNVSMQKSQG